MRDRTIEDIESLRQDAIAAEGALDPARRKRFGQFFTGIPLARLLAAIAVEGGTHSVIDPMAGSGDLLDAVVEHADRNSVTLTRVDATEIDPSVAERCRRRLRYWQEQRGIGAAINVTAADAFGKASSRAYAIGGYDLVITNPPYVRYQSVSSGDDRALQATPEAIRKELRTIVEQHTASIERPVWKALVENYSGLADLSVPSWLLSASLVRPGGRIALVAPATWRSRNYGDVIQCLLSRCFRIEYLIEDTQPGWFSDALVRTQLVVARRLQPEAVAIPISQRDRSSEVIAIVKVSPAASDGQSLVGSAFEAMAPELGLANWLREVIEERDEDREGISVERQPLDDFTGSVLSSLESRRWFSRLEPSGPVGGLFRGPERQSVFLIPSALRAVVSGYGNIEVRRLTDAGISVGQGLRTGCNAFFYVDLVERLPDGEARVRLSDSFSSKEIIVPTECLVPVLRKQSEYDSSRPLNAVELVGQVLDLRSWVLPEDDKIAKESPLHYARAGEPQPRVMPDDLAGYVREAGMVPYGSNKCLIPQLSAVRTNVRRDSDRPPKFWYMLPPFAARHKGEVFIPRINQYLPEATENSRPAALIDANFSTLWADAPWTARALAALLRSSWCRACMEAIGTPMGGGALKLEATQLSQLPVPVLTDEDVEKLDRLALEGPETINLFITQKLLPQGAESHASHVNGAVKAVAANLCAERQKKRR